MQGNISLSTCERDIKVIYGMYDFGAEREAARSSLRYVLTDINDIKNNFIRLGFHLSEMNRCKYYQDFGYPTLEEFSDKNLGMDKSTVYKYIRVFEEFCSRQGEYHTKTMFLDSRYEDYSFSQLVEMCSMNDDQRRRCKPEMTIKEIRVIKSTSKQNNKSGDVATKENNSYLSVSDLFLSGIVKYNKIKNADYDDVKHISLYDDQGKPIFEHLTCDILLSDDNKIILRAVPVDVNKDSWKIKEG